MCEQGLNVMAAAYNQYKVHEYKLPNKDEWIKEMYGYDDSIDFWGCIDREPDYCKHTLYVNEIRIV